MLEIRDLTPLIQVFDMPRSIAFYRDVLELAVTQSSPPRGPDDFDWALLERDGMSLMLNTAYEHENRPVEPDPARLAAHADCGLFFGCRDLDAAYAHLRGHGVDAREPMIAPYGMRQVWLRDPDGYVICLQWPVAEAAAGEG